MHQSSHIYIKIIKARWNRWAKDTNEKRLAQ